MTHVRLKKQGDSFSGFIIKGHAGYTDAEYDMVCTAISVLATTAINAIESVANVKPIYNIIDEDSGTMDITLPINISKSQMYDCQIIIKTMIQGLKDIQEEFPEYINLEA